MAICQGCGYSQRDSDGPCPRCGAPPIGALDEKTTVPLTLPPHIVPGYVFGGGYKIVDDLGEGGFGKVFLARDEGLNRAVAVKFLVLGQVREAKDIPKFKERFRREAQALARYGALSRHVVNVIGVGEDSGAAYFVMEYLPEGTLVHRIKKRGALPPLEAASLIGDVAAALQVVHADGTIHRDIKPHNIFLRRGEAVLGDFGIARLSDMPSLTSSGPPLTVQYASPELVRGQKVDHRSDLFSLGCVLHECLTGRLVFSGDSWMAIIESIRSAEEVDLEPLRYTIPLPLVEILKRSLAKEPSRRYAAAAEMERDLRNVVSTALGTGPPKPGAASKPPEPAAETRKPPSREDRKPPEPAAETRREPDRDDQGPPARKAREGKEQREARAGRERHGPEGASARAGTLAAREETASGRARRWVWPVAAAALVIAGLSTWALLNLAWKADAAAEQAGSKQAAERTGSLRIEGAPPGAAVYLDGVYRGNPTAVMDGLKNGPHALRVSHPDHETREGTITIEAGQTRSANWALAPKSDAAAEKAGTKQAAERTGSLRVQGAPQDVAVYLDGVYRGNPTAVMDGLKHAYPLDTPMFSPGVPGCFQRPL